jgi:hypothetical protein
MFVHPILLASELGYAICIHRYNRMVLGNG